MHAPLASLFFVCMLLSACVDESPYAVGPGTAGQTPLSGYAYVQYTDAPGPVVQPGDHAYFHIRMRTADSLLYSTRLNNRGEPVHLRMKDIADPRVPSSPEVEGLALMSVGDSLTVMYPVDSLDQPPLGVTAADAYLYYDIYLADILDDAAYQARESADMTRKAQLAKALRARRGPVTERVAALTKAYRKGELTDRLRTLDSGLEILVLEEGDGPKPKPGETVSVNYLGSLSDGRSFDDSFKSGRPYKFLLGRGRVIKGWDQGLLKLPLGTEALLVVPPALGYGKRGAPPVIPKSATLFFYVELTGINER